MKLIHAQRIAAIVVRQLSPYCSKIAVAGSIARLKPDNISDIEIVCTPKTLPKPTLIDIGEVIRHPGFVKTLRKWKKIKGDLETGKQIQREFTLDSDQYPSIGDTTVKLDIFIAEPSNWGNIMAIRTGPADYSKAIMDHINSKKGYHHTGGHLYIDGEKQSIPTEEKFFELIGMKFLPANRRK